jgi:6,7-dimethyl-8-ribityllumazine synthase
MAGKGTGGGGPTTKALGAHILIIEARYYEDIADEMAAGAIAVLQKHGCTFERMAVPGALEIPQVLAAVVEAGRTVEDDLFMDDDEEEPEIKPFDGAIALGCVLRGETYHFEIVCNESNRWLMDVALGAGIPVGNAILTVDTEEQAMDRAKGGEAGKGGDAARACLRLIEIRQHLAEGAA